MKSLLLILISVALGIFIATQILTVKFHTNMAPMAANPQTPTTTTPTAPQQKAPPNVAPTTFHGPTGQPHIVGPSSNPPNY